MDKKIEYKRLLRKFDFKTILEYVSNNQNIDNSSRVEATIGSVSIATTDKHPMNKITMLGVLEDGCVLCKNKDGRKTIKYEEMLALCSLRNEVKPLGYTSFEKGEGFGAIFSMSKKQSIMTIGESLPACFQRDFYIITQIDTLMKNNTNLYLNATNYYESLFGTDITTGLAMVMLFFQDTFQSFKTVLKPPFTKYESFFLRVFGDYVVYDHGKNNSFIPLRHCLIKVGKQYYVPFFGLLYNRISHILYWRLKDELKDCQIKNFFPNNFGEYFEEYVDVFLKHSLGEEKYTRIDKIQEADNVEKPDFEFNKASISFVVECKSRLISLDDIRKKLCSGIFREKVIEGLSQLKQYNSKETDCIKIIVLYEDDFPMIEFFESSLREKEKLSDNYWIVTIDEFEALLGLEDDDFKKVVNYKIKKVLDNKPMSLGNVLKKVGVGKQYSNLYLGYIEKQINDKANEILNLYNSI